MKKREEDLAAVQKKSAEEHEAAVGVAGKITELGTIKLTAKAGEGGRLYGKITTKEIAQELSTAVAHEIDKRGIKLNDEITALGTYKATVRVAADVQAEVSVEVTQQGAEAV
jgi:large subunit ribosomal protein L9